MTNNKMEMVKDLPNKKVTVTRYFDANVADVWAAWTQSELLDLWWAPKPWKAETKEMDFRNGGYWLYAMVGPDGTKQYAKISYSAINPEKSYNATDAFCDEHGNPTNELPSMNWHNSFHADGADKTKVIIEIHFANEADFETIMTMGFEEGFTMALGNLDEYFASRA